MKLIRLSKKHKPRWLRISEETNALDNLEKVHLFLLKVHKDIRAWKWIVLCTHSALYGFAICALKGTNYKRVTYTNKKGAEKLIAFPEALKRAQDARYMEMTKQSECLRLTTDEEKAIRRLHEEFRNQFEHFIPMSWSIEVSGMPTIIKHCLRVIRFLALESGNYSSLKKSEKRKINSLVSQSEKVCKALINQI